MTTPGVLIATHRRLRVVFNDNDLRHLRRRIVTHSLGQVAPRVSAGPSLRAKLLEPGISESYVALQIAASAAQQGGVVEHFARKGTRDNTIIRAFRRPGGCGRTTLN